MPPIMSPIISIPTLSTATAAQLKQSYMLAKNTHWSVIKASGTDIRTYLQGQITQDTDKLNEHQAIHACLLSPQGKAVSELYILTGHNHELILLAPSSRAVAAVARLRQFALGHSLRIGIVENLGVYSMHGADALDALKKLGLAASQSSRLSCSGKQDEDIFSLLMQTKPAVYWVIGNMEQIEPHISEPQQTGESALEALRILQGWPEFGIEWDESIHPLNANRIEFDGVDFNKGCYVGQEVTSRMHWRGGIKKKLYRVKLDAIPTELPCPIRSTVNIGELKSAAIDDQGHCFGIALLPIETAQSDVNLTLENETMITILEACHA